MAEYSTSTGEESAQDLLRQGQRWHDVLAGDVSGRDGLRLTDYVAAADSVAGKLAQTARQVVARFKVWLIVALIILAAGIALIVVGTKGAIGAGITAVLAAFGLTWKGIGDFFGRAAANAEGQLWDAEIDWAIAYRFTTLRHPPAGNKLKPRSKELKIDQPTKEHLRRYKQWKKNWPDVLTSGVGSGGGGRTEADRARQTVVSPPADTRDQPGVQSQGRPQPSAADPDSEVSLQFMPKKGPQDLAWVDQTIHELNELYNQLLRMQVATDIVDEPTKHLTQSEKTDVDVRCSQIGTPLVQVSGGSIILHLFQQPAVVSGMGL